MGTNGLKKGCLYRMLFPFKLSKAKSQITCIYSFKSLLLSTSSSLEKQIVNETTANKTRFLVFSFFFQAYYCSYSFEVISSKFVICGALRDLVAFVQFKKHEKHSWTSVTFSKVAG